MSQNSCCVPGCAVVRRDGVPLHRFPDPETSEEKIKTWILNIGGEIAKLDHQAIYDNRRVCHRHFEDIQKYPSGRLSKLAIPTIHIPDPQAQSLDEAIVMSESCVSNTSASTSNIETAISKPALASPNIEAIISKPPLASTSNGPQSNNLISDKLVIKVCTHTRDSWARSFNARKNAKKAGSFVSPYKHRKEMLFLKKVKFRRIVEESDETEGDEEEEEKVQEIIAESDSNSTAVCENELNVDKKEDIDLISMNQDNTTNDIDDTEKSQDNNISGDMFNADLTAMNQDNTTTNEVDNTERKRNSNISEDMLNEIMQAYLNKQMRKPSNTHDDRHFAFFKSVHPTLTLFDDDQILEFQSGVINLLRNIISVGRFKNVANNQPSSSRGYYSQPEAPYSNNQSLDKE